MEELPLALPPDEYNAELIKNVHPFDWKNPEPAPMYNLVVIGAGTAGLVSAAGAAGLGAKVALIEKRLMGGDCLNLGCVPSKTVISSSRVSREVKEAVGHGVRVICGSEADFPAVMERMRRLRARISKADSVSRFKELGVDVFLGAGRFSGPGEVKVDGKTLHFKKAVIATGAHAFHPPIPGLSDAGYMTNESVFNLVSQPKRLAVLGGGAIGCELAQAFQRLGSEVTILQNKDRLMNMEDPDASEILQHVFKREGVRMVFGEWILKRVETKAGEKLLHIERDGEKDVIAADELLVATGRSPNVQDLGLEAAGVDYDARGGVVVDETLRTTNPDIYAAGDICLKYKFTHTADAAARVVIQNALFMGRQKLSAHTVPWCTFTDPEIAHVGMYEEGAQAHGILVDTFMRRFSDIDRAVLEGEEEEGFVKVHVKRGTDRILGATIVGAHAGEMISEITLAMEAGVGLKKISETIHPYPTRSEAIKKVADDYNRTRLTPAVKKILARWLEFKRKT